MSDQPAIAPNIVAQETLYLEPTLLAGRLKGQRHVTLLESVMRHEHLGRYSFLACNPSHTLRVERDVAFLDGVAQDKPPLVMLQRLLSEERKHTMQGLPPFQGGWAGYISYEFGKSLEAHSKLPDFEPLCPDLILHRYDTVVSFDHLQEKAWIVSSDADCAAALEKFLRGKAAPLGAAAIEGWQSNFTRAAYEAAIAKTVEYILAGDIFQANITQCFSAAIPDGFDAFALFRKLRDKNPATFAAFLDYGDVQIASSSPERLIKSDGTEVEARPIKGTRKRDLNPARDAELMQELQASRKDCAENVMIVDLLRNDISRIARPGTVHVPVLCGLESYANVHHLVSVVTGALRDGISQTDLLRAIFPGGSITGAPKIRAMEIIAELEAQARGVYCGAIGYFGFNGACDFNIAIRTALFSGGKAYVQGGGGITARSQPAAEYEESLTKIKRIMEAFSP
ncbi:MAG: aminodeoxychorismate synthase component I [Alphaproteobacteria bacterium]|nr:aminodeoxychorismate synthase component I [Alphaproteobacteria bacterium]